MESTSRGGLDQYSVDGGVVCWFSAFALQNAAYVKAVGQIELIFSLVVTVLFFKEKITLREWIGVGVLGLSVIAMVVLA